MSVIQNATTLRSLAREKYRFWNAIDSVVTGVRSGDHRFVLMDMNARTGKRRSGCAGSKVLGAYGRDESNDTGERLLVHRPNNKHAVDKTLFPTSNRGVLYMFQ